MPGARSSATMSRSLYKPPRMRYFRINVRYVKNGKRIVRYYIAALSCDDAMRQAMTRMREEHPQTVSKYRLDVKSVRKDRVRKEEIDADALEVCMADVP